MSNDFGKGLSKKVASFSLWGFLGASPLKSSGKYFLARSCPDFITLSYTSEAWSFLSILNILLVITIWKKSYPSWIIESKSLNLVRYGSNILVNIIPLNTINQLQKIFEIDISQSISDDSKDFQAEQYGEPDLNKNKNLKKEGYSNNDNESLNKLFNIENND